MRIYFPLSSAFRRVYFSQFHISQFHISPSARFVISHLRAHSSRQRAKCKFHIFPPNPSTRPPEALWAQNEGIEKTAQTEPDGPFLHIFVRLTSHFTSFRSPICTPSRPPFSRPPENTLCKTHRHLCIFTRPPIQFATPPLTFQSSPPREYAFFGGNHIRCKGVHTHI